MFRELLVRCHRSSLNRGSGDDLAARTFRAVRVLRVLAYRGIHEQLLSLPIYREFEDSTFGDDPFHHLSHRYYLRKGLSIKRRANIVYEHYSLESAWWDESYLDAVYSMESPDGLELWRKVIDGVAFSISLRVAKRAVPEGDICVTLSVNGIRIHRMNYSWTIDRSSKSVSLFAARSQSSPCEGGFELFRQHFPKQHPQFFCFAAVQGVAEVASVSLARGVRACEQICGGSIDNDSHFGRVYDDFWMALGGWDDGGDGFLIPLPAHTKSLQQLSATHRRRAQKRRKQWSDITVATVDVLSPHFRGHCNLLSRAGASTLHTSR